MFHLQYLPSSQGPSLQRMWSLYLTNGPSLPLAWSLYWKVQLQILLHFPSHSAHCNSHHCNNVYINHGIRRESFSFGHYFNSFMRPCIYLCRVYVGLSYIHFVYKFDHKRVSGLILELNGRKSQQEAIFRKELYKNAIYQDRTINKVQIRAVLRKELRLEFL